MSVHYSKCSPVAPSSNSQQIYLSTGGLVGHSTKYSLTFSIIPFCRIAISRSRIVRRTEYLRVSVSLNSDPGLSCDETVCLVC